jgi:hypothetical protein
MPPNLKMYCWTSDRLCSAAKHDYAADEVFSGSEVVCIFYLGVLEVDDWLRSRGSSALEVSSIAGMRTLYGASFAVRVKVMARLRI